MSNKVDCKYCGESFSRQGIANHLNACQRKIADDEVECDYCDKSFSQRGIANHMNACKKKITQSKQLECDYCDKLFTAKNILAHEDECKQRQTEKVRCTYCANVYSKQGITNHVKACEKKYANDAMTQRVLEMLQSREPVVASIKPREPVVAPITNIHVNFTVTNPKAPEPVIIQPPVVSKAPEPVIIQPPVVSKAPETIISSIKPVKYPDFLDIQPSSVPISEGVQNVTPMATPEVARNATLVKKININSISGSYTDDILFGSETDRIITLNDRLNASFSGYNKFDLKKYANITGIKFVSMWRDGSNGTISINSGDLVIQCQVFRGAHWQVLIYE